jgi:hypothetical protein
VADLKLESAAELRRNPQLRFKRRQRDARWRLRSATIILSKMTKVSWGIKAAKIAPDNKIKPTAALVAVNNMQIVS